MKNEFRADLHCHSSCSDGTDTPLELLDKAVQAGLQGLSITDHDTIAAYTSDVFEKAVRVGIKLLSGVEFSAWHKAEPVHILGYAFPIDAKEIAKLCLWHRERRLQRNRDIIHNLRRLGIPIREDELFASDHATFGRPHIAALLVEKGIVKSIQDAFHKYLGEGKPGYSTGKQLSVEETLAHIHAAKGKAILAHPHLLKRSRTIKALLQMPFDGLEAYYAKLPLDQEKVWIEHAEKKGWLITGGSDYHGEVKPQIPLGCSWIGEEVFSQLYAHFTAT